jgi:DNA-binding transcriptional LysR family regulator
MTEIYDPDLLVTFLAVAETGSFSQAARRRGLRQSTVSQQVRRLEAETRRRLFDRDTHNVSLTVDGQALTVLAGEILAAYSRAERYFSNTELRGRVRFGASDDFALSSLLPQVLRAFSSRHPAVDLEMRVGFAADLYQAMDEGVLDLIFAKRRVGDGRGRVVWREDMVWIAAPDWRRDPERPLPLVLYPPRSITREAVLAALEKADVSWRIACTCGSLSGLVGAVLGGLGVGAQSARLKAEGTVVVGPEAGLPPLGETEFVVVPALGRPKAPAHAKDYTTPPPAERAGAGDGRHDPGVRPRLSCAGGLRAPVSKIAPQGPEFGSSRIGLNGEARQIPEPSLCLCP